MATMSTENEDQASSSLQYSIAQLTLRDSLKAEKLFVVSRPVSRLRDLFRYRGTLNEASDAIVLSSFVESDGCSSVTISRLLRRMFRPAHGREPRFDANRYLACSTLD